MEFSEQVRKEIKNLSPKVAHDMKILRRKRHNPFIKDGKVDIKAYLEFITGFNEFIKHQPKPFRKIIDSVMKL